MSQQIVPVRALHGIVQPPGDKSVSHRYAMLASLAEGTSLIKNYSTGADCQSTLGCMKALGISSENADDGLRIHGRGLEGLTQAGAMLDAGNSGSTIRMLSGILAAQSFSSIIGGDESLSRRPMERIMKPLTAMGARIQARDGRFPPLQIEGARLQPLEYTLPMASAQVKTCVLFAGLYAEGETVVYEPMRTRDHTELALREFGAECESSRERTETESRWITRLRGRPRLEARELTVPGDLSSAAFFLVAAQIVQEASITVHAVGLNPTRSALLDFLAGMGVNLTVLDIQQTGGELIGDIRVRKSPVRGGLLEKAQTAALIDEIPVLAVLGAMSDEGLIVRDAAELRVKETDRIATLAENFRRMGMEITVHPDGFAIPGKQRPRAATLDSFGDHRIAMAFAVAALAADGPCVIEGSEAASVSYPEFYNTLRELAQ